MTRQDLQELAEVRLKDARVLLDAGRFSGAYYVAGYVVECALKACIAKQFHEHEFPDLQKVKQIYTHGYDTLVRVAGLDLATELRSEQFAANWELVKKWTEKSRYETCDDARARALIAAISDTESGVLQWLRRNW
jgi:HEPN domain-containing protein